MLIVPAILMWLTFLGHCNIYETIKEHLYNICETLTKYLWNIYEIKFWEVLFLNKELEKKLHLIRLRFAEVFSIWKTIRSSRREDALHTDKFLDFLETDLNFLNSDLKWQSWFLTCSHGVTLKESTKKYCFDHFLNDIDHNERICSPTCNKYYFWSTFFSMSVSAHSYQELQLIEMNKLKLSLFIILVWFTLSCFEVEVIKRVLVNQVFFFW